MCEADKDLNKIQIFQQQRSQKRELHNSAADKDLTKIGFGDEDR